MNFKAQHKPTGFSTLCNPSSFSVESHSAPLPEALRERFRVGKRVPTKIVFFGTEEAFDEFKEVIANFINFSNCHSDVLALPASLVKNAQCFSLATDNLKSAINIID